MSSSAHHTPQVSLLTDKPTIDDYSAPEHVPSLDKAYSTGGASYTDMIQTEVDLACQLAHTTDHTDCAHIACALDQSHELQHQIFNEPTLTQPSMSDNTCPVDTATLLASYNAMQQPLSFTDRVYATSAGRADTTDTAQAWQFPAAWRLWGAGGDFDGSDANDDTVLSAMHDASALKHSPTLTQPLTTAAPLLCRVGHPVTDFRDELSVCEFCISGFCQACQDNIFEPAEFDSNIATQLADGTHRISSDPSVHATSSAALASAPAGELTNHTKMMNHTDTVEWLQVDHTELTSVLCTAPHWTSDHPGLSMSRTSVQRPALLVGPTNAASDPSDSMGDGPQGVATTNDDADSALLPDLNLRTTTEVAEAEYACASTHTPEPRTATTQDRQG